MIADWRNRLAQVTEMMREISSQSDPQELYRRYSNRIRTMESFDRYVSVSRRGLERPWFRITRDSEWTTAIDPWKERDRLPLLCGGVLAELVHSNQAHLLVDRHVPDSDPAAPFIAGFRTLIAVPHFDHGEALNWVLHLRRSADYDPNELPELVWTSNLFGRVTHNLVLAQQLNEAKSALEMELELVASVQRSLLPELVPQVPGLRLAASACMARKAGGDYHCVFPLSEDRTGLLVADASGHSAPATVLMAMLHALAHQRQDQHDPSAFLHGLDQDLTRAAPRGGGAFVTAFYAVFDPRDRRLRYACAGHPPARLRRSGGAVQALDLVGEPPLGLGMADRHDCAEVELVRADTVICLTDGLTDTLGPSRARFATERLDRLIATLDLPSPDEVIQAIVASASAFAEGVPLDDDCTILAAVVQ